MQADGKILVAGYGYNGLNYDFALVRYNSDGSLDTSFSTDGKAHYIDRCRVPPTVSPSPCRPTGRSWLAAMQLARPAIEYALARYNSDGTPRHELLRRRHRYHRHLG